MHFGVNAQRLVGQRLGVGRYIEYMVSNWRSLLTPDERMTVYVREAPSSPGGVSAPDRLRYRVLRPPLSGLTWENAFLPWRASELDVLFCPSYTRPLAYVGKTVVAIHSVNEIASGTHPWWYGVTYAPLYRQSARRADMVIVPSRNTLRDIQALYGIEASKLVVIPQGADDVFQPSDDERAASAVRRRYFIEERPFILFVGKLSQRRNVELLIEAFAAAVRGHGLPHGLLLLGPNHLGFPLAETAERLGVADRVVQDDGKFAHHRELAAVYQAADAYVNASLYEGFSMTLVEAMACGLPVIVSARGALPEIAGDAGLMIHDPTVDAFATAIRSVLTDRTLAEDLRGRSAARAAGYRWQPFARQTLDVLRHVAAA